MKNKYSPELFDKICEEIATTSNGLKYICAQNDVTASAFYVWIDKDKDLLDRYMRARDAQADLLADEIIEIADHSEEDHTPFTGGNVVNRDKLRIESRKWIASKLKPKKYGDKLDVTTDGEKITSFEVGYKKPE